MPSAAESPDTVLIVDDEEPVRKTFREWLESAGLDCRILSAADAESALVQANQFPIDLAILDWNLGAGNDGLRLLEDLYLFNPNIVAILVTGFAHQATPLDAMRMGVRDYLDKNQDLNRPSFLHAVTRQLERIRPAKRERRLHQSLVAFRDAVEKVLPLVQAAAALNDPVPLPEAIRSLLRFLQRSTGARESVLVIHSYDAQREPQELNRAYDAAGNALAVELVPFARSIAGTVVSLQRPYATQRLDESVATGGVELQPFERGRASLLAAPLNVLPGIQVVFELFDKRETGDRPAPFTAEDERRAGAAAEFGSEILRQALTERQTHQMLLDAVGAALGASESVAQSLGGTRQERMEQPPPAAVLDRLREGLRAAPGAAVEADEALRLAEAVRVLALRHGPAAVNHCIGLVENVRALLDAFTGAGESAP